MTKFIGYIFTKWSLFYIYQLSEYQKFWDFKNVNIEGLFLATFMFLALPLIEVVILFYPMLLALRQKPWIKIMILSQAFGLEFLLGWIVTNQQLAIWMIIKILLSIALFGLLYRKQLKSYTIRNSNKEA